MIGSAIGGRVSFNTSDDHDAMDGELVCRWVVHLYHPCRGYRLVKHKEKDFNMSEKSSM